MIGALRVKGIMHPFLAVHDRNHSAIWIGATDEAVEGVWRWYTDNSLLQYNSLMPSEYYDRDQDCILMWGGFNYDWGDFQCDRPEYFICEKRQAGPAVKNAFNAQLN